MAAKRTTEGGPASTTHVQPPMLSTRDLEARRAMEDATRLAAQGKYRCRVCNKIDAQERGLLIAFAGNVLLAVCPSCVHAPIVIQCREGSISVQMQGGQARRVPNIVLARSMREVEGAILAQPQVKQVKL